MKSVSWPKDIRGFWLRNEQLFPVGWVATRRLEDTSIGHTVIELAVSAVNPKDMKGKNYIHGLQKRIAINRLAGNSEADLHYVSADGNVKLNIMKYLARPEFPMEQVRLAARYWLSRYVPREPSPSACEFCGAPKDIDKPCAYCRPETALAIEGEYLELPEAQILPPRTIQVFISMQEPYV